MGDVVVLSRRWPQRGHVVKPHGPAPEPPHGAPDPLETTVRRGALVSVAPDGGGRFRVEDYNDSGGGLTFTRDGQPLTGLRFERAVELAARIARRSDAVLDTEAIAAIRRALSSCGGLDDEGAPR